MMQKKVVSIRSISFFIIAITALATGFLSLVHTVTPPLATADTVSILDMGHYVQKYEFYNPKTTYTLSASQKQKLSAMIPAAITGAQKYNAAYHSDVEPPLIVWWSYAEGIGGEISFSNCNDTVYTITNCYHPASWQLGYGIQFAAIDLLKSAFSNTHGDSNNKSLVQQVGQGVLNHDMTQGTTPRCGGFSCTFPSMTIDQIMSGVNVNRETTNNWWASVLSRDPLINSFMDAEALRVQRFNRKIAWSWGSYYQTHWQEYSDRLATILKNWKDLGGCPNPSDCTAGVTIYPTPTDNPTPTPEPPPCYKFDIKTGGCNSFDTPFGPLQTNPAELVNQLFRIILSIAGGVAMLLIIAAGYKLMTSQGNPEKVKEARESLTAAIVGLIFIIFSLTILQIIGIDILHIPGFGR